MKNIKYSCLSLLITFALSQASFAQTTSLDNPKECPTINAVKAAGLTDATNGMLGWIAYTLNRYDSTDTWFFGVPVAAKDKDEAIKKGNENINQFTEIEGPIKSPGDTWVCVYTSSNPYILGLALTPVPSMNAAIANFVKFRK